MALRRRDMAALVNVPKGSSVRIDSGLGRGGVVWGNLGSCLFGFTEKCHKQRDFFTILKHQETINTENILQDYLCNI
jgi:hypothetical protein